MRFTSPHKHYVLNSSSFPRAATKWTAGTLSPVRRRSPRSPWGSVRTKLSRPASTSAMPPSRILAPPSSLLQFVTELCSPILALDFLSTETSSSSPSLSFSITQILWPLVLALLRRISCKIGIVSCHVKRRSGCQRL